MFDRIKKAFTGVTAAQNKGFALVSHWLKNVLWLVETKYLALAAKAVGQNSIVYSAVRFLSQSAAEPHLKVYQQISVDEREEQPLEHTYCQLIKQPNELMTEYEMLEMITIHLAIIGRTVWLKERDNKGQLKHLWPLRPDRVAPVYSADLEPGNRVLAGWSYQIPGTGQFVQIPRSDAFFLNFCDPAGESSGIVEGLGPIAALAREISADNTATEFVGAMLANHATPSVVIKVKASVRSEAEANMIKSKFRAEFGGSHRGTPALVDGDTSIEPLRGFTLRELEFPDVRGIAESRICAALGVPPVLLGLKVGLEHSTFSNMEEARSFFTEVTLCSLWKRLEDGFNTQLSPEFGENIVVEFDLSKVKALAGRRLQQIQPVVDAFKSGAATRNEYRQALGMPLLDPELGEVLLVPSAVTEVPLKKPKEAAPPALPEPEQKLLPPGKEEEQPDAEQPKEEKQSEETEGKQPQSKKPSEEAKKAIEEVERLLGIRAANTPTVWLGMYLPKEIARQLALDDPLAESVEDLHMTLAVLHAPSPQQLEALPDIVSDFCLRAGPLDARISGLGRFSQGNNDVFYASVDCGVLPQFRTALVDWLGEAGLALDILHGFTPHVTLAYLSPSADLPADRLVPVSFRLGILSLSIGRDSRQDFALSGTGIPEQLGDEEGEAESGLKHLPGQHDQNAHGGLNYSAMPKAELREHLDRNVQLGKELSKKIETRRDNAPNLRDYGFDRRAEFEKAVEAYHAETSKLEQQYQTLGEERNKIRAAMQQASKFAIVAEGGLPISGQPLVSDREQAVQIALELGAEAVEIRGVVEDELPIGVELVGAST